MRCWQVVCVANEFADSKLASNWQYVLSGIVPALTTETSDGQADYAALNNRTIDRHNERCRRRTYRQAQRH